MGFIIILPISLVLLIRQNIFLLLLSFLFLFQDGAGVRRRPSSSLGTLPELGLNSPVVSSWVSRKGSEELNTGKKQQQGGAK